MAWSLRAGFKLVSKIKNRRRRASANVSFETTAPAAAPSAPAAAPASVKFSWSVTVAALAALFFKKEDEKEEVAKNSQSSGGKGMEPGTSVPAYFRMSYCFNGGKESFVMVCDETSNRDTPLVKLELEYKAEAQTVKGDIFFPLNKRQSWFCSLELDKAGLLVGYLIAGNMVVYKVQDGEVLGPSIHKTTIEEGQRILGFVDTALKDFIARG